MRLGRLADEVEDPVGLLPLEGHRVGLEGVDEVGELDRVADEEDRQVVADQVPVAVLGVELHREAARVARRLGGVAAADHGREADGEVGALARLLEQLGPGERRRSARRRTCRRPRSSRTRVGAAGVHDALGDALAVEVGDLLEELVVLQRRRAAGADGALVLVVVDRVALAVGQDRAGRRHRWSVMRAPRGGSGRADGSEAEAGGHRPQKMTSASSTTKPWASDGSRHGAAPTAQSTSAVSPQLRHTRWWWLSPTRVSYRAGDPPARCVGRARPG